MTVKILHKIFLLLLLATFMLTSCHDDDEPIDEPTEQTVIFFMPWSTNMTPYFEQNIVDFETAIKGGLLKNERVIVCISSTTSRANVIELRQEQNRCVRDTLMFYNQPDFTQHCPSPPLLAHRGLSRYGLAPRQHKSGTEPIPLRAR